MKTHAKPTHGTDTLLSCCLSGQLAGKVIEHTAGKSLQSLLRSDFHFAYRGQGDSKGDEKKKAEIKAGRDRPSEITEKSVKKKGKGGSKR